MKTKIVIVLLLLSTAVFAQQAPTPPPAPAYGAPISLEAAKKISAASEAFATDKKWPVVIVIVDTGGNLVLIHKIDSIGPKPLEHPFDSLLDMVRLAVEPHLETAGLRIDIPTELRGDCDLVAEWCDALTEDSFAFQRPISLSRIKKRHAMVIGRADDVDHLRAVRHGRFVFAAHVLHSEPDAGNFQDAESPALAVCRGGGSRGLRSGGGRGGQGRCCKAQGDEVSAPKALGNVCHAEIS